ncbi:MAG: DUF58 domain-containing protein [Polyangiales bacterium]
MSGRVMLSKDLIKKLRRIEIRTTRLAQEQLAGSYHSVFKGRGMTFAKVRPYQPGDDVRFIDWNVTARMQEPYVKVFSEEREITVMLLVDLSASAHFASCHARKLDRIAEVAAVLAFSAIKNNDRVGLLLFTDRVERFVPPKKGRAHVMRVIAEIFRHEPQGRGTDLSVALDRLAHMRQRHTVTFVLSDFITAGYARALQLACVRHDIVALTVVDPAEAELPPVGITAMRDLESGVLLEVDCSSATVRERYRARFLLRQRARWALFRRLGVDGCELSTAEPYLPVLSALFRRRAKRVRGYR